WSRLLRQHPRDFIAAALIALPKGEPLWDLHDNAGVIFPLIADPDHSLSARYPGPGEGSAALGCPRAWVIGRDGRYRYIMPMGSAPTPEVMRQITRALGLRS